MAAADHSSRTRLSGSASNSLALPSARTATRPSSSTRTITPRREPRNSSSAPASVSSAVRRASHSSAHAPPASELNPWLAPPRAHAPGTADHPVHPATRPDPQRPTTRPPRRDVPDARRPSRSTAPRRVDGQPPPRWGRATPAASSRPASLRPHSAVRPAHQPIGMVDADRRNG